MTTRDAFLARVRAQLGTDADVGTGSVAVPEPAYVRDLADPVVAFTEAAQGSGAIVRRIVTDDDLRDLLEETGARTVVRTRDPETAAVLPLLSSVGMGEAAFDSPGAAAAADLGIAGGAWGIAATGSVVIDAGRAGGRSASLLPPGVLFLVARDRILTTAAVLFRRLGEHYPEGLPSQLVLVTGPSRTADIELVLTVGVHGPGRVWIAIV
ncbi:MAG TPA: LUD domain-containing protein [Actinomycetota bacterium]|nr:LUD domain-containing protein [Actinomycetota bacterium]